MYDLIVVGAGFAGATVAERAAREGKKVLLLEKRGHIGGNMYEEYDKNGVFIHKYGPHIFHTNKKNVFDYLSKFTEWTAYKHKVLGNIHGTLVPVPFNYKAIDMLLDNAEELKDKLTKTYQGKETISILELINSNDEIIKEFGNYVFENIFAHYTAKQWGVPISEVDTSVINRVPVVLGYRDTYFGDEFQFMPRDGFTKIFEKMLENVTVELNVNAIDRFKLENNKVYFDGVEFSNPIVFTGEVDELLGYKYGELPYRSLRLEFESLDVTQFQPAAVVNYTVSEDFTRITEFKYLTGQKNDGHTNILKEYPLKYIPKKTTAYYPIINDENAKLFAKYKNDIEKFGNIYLCGRLAEYKYYNMDAVVDRALELYDEIKNY